MSKFLLPPVALCFGLLSASAALAQQVNLTMTDGRVTLKAQNATVRQILDEWARVGGTKIVNAEKIANQPVTLTLIDEPEGQALETILRSAPGYILAERTNPTPSGSRFERIMVMARTTPVTTTASAGTTNQSAVTVAGPTPPGGAFPAEGPVSADEDEPPQPMAPVVNPYAQPGGPGASRAHNANVGAPGGFSNLPGQQGAQQGAATIGAPGAVSTPPETKFDYANPQKYFQQQQLQQQQQQQANPMQLQPYPGVPVSTSGVGAATGTPAQPTPGAVPGTGDAGTVTPVTPSNQNPYSPNFNPYNLPPGQGVPGQGVPGAVGTTPQTTPTPVQPDRAKYANPYIQPNTQQPPQ